MPRLKREEKTTFKDDFKDMRFVILDELQDELKYNWVKFIPKLRSETKLSETIIIKPYIQWAFRIFSRKWSQFPRVMT